MRSKRSIARWPCASTRTAIRPRRGCALQGITKAYEILSDPAKREEYNQSLNHRIIIDAEAEAYQLWRSVFNLHGTKLPPA
jgi:molecular chaperone DnaJ